MMFSERFCLKRARRLRPAARAFAERPAASAAAPPARTAGPARGALEWIREKIGIKRNFMTASPARGARTSGEAVSYYQVSNSAVPRAQTSARRRRRPVCPLRTAVAGGAQTGKTGIHPEWELKLAAAPARTNKTKVQAAPAKPFTFSLNSALVSLFFLFFMAGCSSLEEEPESRSRAAAARKFKTRAAKAKERRKRAPLSSSDDYAAERGIASLRDSASFSESGLDFLSKKLEDAVSGYKSLHEKISGLEDRLSRLIFLLEAKAHAIAQRESELDEEEDEEAVLMEEGILPYAEALAEGEDPEEAGKKKAAASSSSGEGEAKGGAADEGAAAAPQRGGAPSADEAAPAAGASGAAKKQSSPLSSKTPPSPPKEE